MTDYEFHPLCLAFPAMTAGAYAKRLADYRKHPERADDTVVLLAADEEDAGKLKILDGRHHYRICKELGYECGFETVAGDRDELADIAESRGINRRHQSETQIAAALVALNAFRHGGDRKSEAVKNQAAPVPLDPAKPKKSKGKTQSEAAKTSGVSERTIRSAGVAAKAEPDLLPAMRDGKIDAKTAEKVAKLPAATRKKVAGAKDPKKAATAALKKAKEEKASGAQDVSGASQSPKAPEEDPENPPADQRFMPNAAEAVALADSFKNLVSRLRAARTDLRKCFPDESHLKHRLALRINFGEFDAQLSDLIETLDRNLPECVCPPCCGTGTEGGKDCKYCDGYGIVDRHHHDGLKAKWKHTRPRLLELRGGA